MEYRQLGRSGLRVSAIAMGTFTFGGRGAFGMVGDHGVPEAQRVVDLCIDHGVNLFDTANMYSAGRSEEILGEVLAGRRDRVLVSSKVRMPMGDGPNDQGCSRHHIIAQCELSLKRLRTDHIDIYHIHEWDGMTPVEEMVSALDTLVMQGKVRYLGCSNFSAWQVMKALGAADRAGQTRFATQQIHYTLEAREAEYELLPLSVDQGLGVTVWSPLAAGLLTGKHRRGRKAPEGSRQAAGWSEPPIRDLDRLWNIVDGLVGGDGRRAWRAAGAGGPGLATDAARRGEPDRRRAQRGAVPREFRRARAQAYRGGHGTPERRQPTTLHLSLLAPGSVRA